MRRIIVALLFSFSLLGQGGDYSISGVVVNSQTGEPVKYALVTVMHFSGMDSGELRDPEKIRPPERKVVQTGSQGEFQLSGLGKAHYSVSAQKPGFNAFFSPKEPGVQQLDLAASVTGLQLKLAPLGTIEGKVVDQNDEPLRGVRILAIQMQVMDGFRQTNAPRSVATDDRGVYRIWNVMPGKYYIKAAGKSGGTTRFVGDSSPYYSSWQGFSPVYFGGGKTLDMATPLQIEAGTNATADFHLNVEPAFRIRGTIANAPAENVVFDLLQGAEDVAASRASINANTEKFEVQDVTAGTYTLRATQAGKLSGEVTVTVSDRDVEGLVIPLAPAVKVQGVTRVMGAPLKVKDSPGFSRITDGEIAEMGAMDPDQVKAFGDQTIPTNCNVMLHSRVGGVRQMPMTPGMFNDRAEPREKGSFVVGEFLPGEYDAKVNCQGGYATAVLFGGTDLLANPTVVIQPGVTPPPIEVQVKPGGGMLEGELAVQPLPENASVLLVPAFGNSTGPVISLAMPSEKGDKLRFFQTFLAPGEYKAYAFTDWQNVEFRNPKFLESLSGGVVVRIEDGKDAKVSLTQMSK